MTNMWRNGFFIIYCTLISLGIRRVEACSGHVCTKYWVTYFPERFCARYNWWTGAYDCKYWTTHQSSKLSSAQYCCGGLEHNGNEICTILADAKSVPANARIIKAMKYPDYTDEISSAKSIVKRQGPSGTAEDNNCFLFFQPGCDKKINICGGNLIAQTTSKILTSPNYPFPYANNLNCTWTIEAPVNYVIVIRITYLDLEVNAACSYDYLSITIGRNSGLETNRICTNATNDVRYISMSNQAILAFVTDGSTVKIGFTVQYQAALNCSKGLRAQTQTAALTLPLYPSKYENNMTCHFTIEGPANSTIVMEITSIDLEESADCSYDFLQIYLGQNYSLATDRICKDSMKNIKYISRYNEADVYFVTDSSVVKTGFSLQYRVATNFGGRLLSGLTSTTLSSPYYPLQYENNLNYHWTIEASNNSRIYIQILSIDVEENNDCSYDYLQIYMGDVKLIETGRICRNNTNNLNLITRSDKADVIFVTDGSIKKTGFSLNYKSVPQCGGYLSVQNAPSQLTSPGYPSQYPNNSYCLWTIKGPIKSRIALNITYIDIQGNDYDCPFDFLQIYMGYHYILRTKLLCGNSTKGLIFISGSNEVDVIFITDGSITKTGFSLQYISVSYCGGHLSAGTAPATLSSPNYPIQYDNYLRCHWTINVPINYRIVINITNIDLEESGDCSKDYLLIYLDTNYILETDRVCRNNNVPYNLISMSNEVHVIFITDESIAKRGFSLQYQADAHVTILADKSFSKAGETVNLKCSIPSFIERASWIVNNTGMNLSNCPPNGPCSPTNDAARYVYSATAISISVTITSFNLTHDTFGWKCQYGNSSTVFVINPKIPVTTVQLTNTSGEPLPSIINIARGGITNMTCSTAPGGSIPRATFRWYNQQVNQSRKRFGNQSISFTPDAIKVPGQLSSDFVISYSTLTLTGDPLYQNVYIFCEARDGTNTGNYTQSGEVQINIVYRANITEFVAKDNILEIMENSTLELHCRVDSNPYPEITLSLGDVLKSATQDVSELIYIATAGCLDGGKYICSAINSVMNGVKVSAEVNLKVRCHPRSDYRTNISAEYYAALDDSVTLNVIVIAYPEPMDIMWYHRATETDAWHQVQDKSFSSSGLNSNISVHLGSQRDFGDYLVNMSNSLGTYEHVFHVISGVVTQGPPSSLAGPIAGGVASGAVVAGICIIIVIILKKRRKLRRKEGTSLELNASTNETSDGLEYMEQHINMTEERYVGLPGVSMRSCDNVSTNEASDGLEYEELSVNMAEESYIELAHVSGRSGGNLRKAHGSGAARITHIYMNQGIEGENVVYDNNQERK